MLINDRTMAKREFTPNSTVTVDGTEIKTFKKELSSANIIEVEVGTTGHMGGDTGHGGRTYFRLSNVADTDIRMRYRDCGEELRARDLGGIELTLGGDCELDTFCEALRIGYEVLSQHAFGLEDTEEEPVDGIDWEQRRYEIARNILPYCAETTRAILMAGHALGDEFRGMSAQEAMVRQAVTFADTLITELKRGR